MKKQLSIFFIFFVICLTGAVLSSCTGSDKTEIQRERAVSKLLKKHRIKIAVAGPWSRKNNYLFEGLSLACEEINSSGGVLGAQLELIPFDDNDNISTGEKVAYQICNDKEIGIVIGHTVSDLSVRNSLIYYYYGVLQFSPLSTNYKLTNSNLKTVFRNIPIDYELGASAADFCAKRNWKRIIVYSQDTDYADGLADAFELQANYNRIFITDHADFTVTSHVENYLDDIMFWQKNYDFDAIFIAGALPQTGEVISLIRESGIKQPIIGGDSFDDWMFFQSVKPDSLDEIYCVSNFNNDESLPSYSLFRKNFRARFGHDDDQEAYQGYDAVKVIADAIVKTGSVKPSELARVMHSDIQWNELAGPYSFDKEGDVAGRTIIIKKAGQGKFVKITE